MKPIIIAGIALLAIMLIVFLFFRNRNPFTVELRPTPTPQLEPTQTPTPTPTPTPERTITPLPTFTVSPTPTMTRSTRNLVSNIETEEMISEFNKAIKNVRLTDILSTSGPYTVFAPSNNALSDAPQTKGGVMNDESATNDLLKYHIVYGDFDRNSLYSTKRITALNGKEVNTDGTVNSPTINGSQIVKTIQSSNGTIHIVDKMLTP